MKQAILLLPLTALMRAVATGWLRMSFADMMLTMRLYVVFAACGSACCALKVGQLRGWAAACDLVDAGCVFV